jgi:hypothetical protein
MRQPKPRRRPLNKALVEQLYQADYSAEQIRLAGGTAAAGGVLLGLAGIGSGAQAATFTVTNLNDSGAGSLRQAILDAEASSDADTIVFQSGLSGTIQLTTGNLEIFYSVDIQGPGADIITVSGGGVPDRSSRGEGVYSGGVFQIGPDVSLYQGGERSNRGALPAVAISGLTITNGFAGFGGNISNTSAELTIEDCVVSNGTAYYDGGGIFNSAITHVIDSTVSGNEAAYGDGGGVFSGDYYDARLTTAGTTISDGYAYYEGGGISSDSGSLAIATTIVSGNTGSTGGGGVYAHIDADGAIDISDSEFSGNDTNYGDAGGGGIEIEHTGTSIRASTVSGNSAVGSGGGIRFHNHYYASDFENLTVSGNSAAAVGGGIALDAQNDDTVLNFVTITGNTASAGGGLNAYYANATGEPTIANSVIAGNNGGSDFEGNLDNTTLSFSAIGTENAVFNDGGGNLFNVDPMLGALADNGGATQTHLPLPGSPLIDAADPAFAPPPATDQRGQPRVSGGRADMGAVEATAALAAGPQVPVPATSNPALALLAAAMAAIGLVGLSRRLRGGSALAALLATGLLMGADPALAARPDHDEVKVGTVQSARAAQPDNRMVEVRLADGSTYVARRGHLRVIDHRSGDAAPIQSLSDLASNQAVMVRVQRSERGRISSLKVVLFDSVQAAEAHRLAKKKHHAH